MAYENFPEATEKAAKILAPVGAALAVPYEMAEKVVTFLDQRTGQIISRKWNSLDPYTQNLIKGFGKIISVTYLAKQAGAILNISKELDAAKLAKIKREGQKTNLGTISGSYTALKDGPLPNNLASTFSSGRYTEIILEKDAIFYRAGSSSQPLGQFFSQEPPRGVLQSRIDKAILPHWPTGGTSPIDSSIAVKVPAGTKIYVGEVGSQGGVYVGGTQQIIIEKPWNIKGIEVKEVKPLQ